MESLTDAVEADAWAYLDKIDGMGGAVAAIEAGYMQEEIEQAAYTYTKAVDAGKKVIVGVNRYVDDNPEPAEVFPIDPALQAHQIERVRRTRAERDQACRRRRPGRRDRRRPGHRQPAATHAGGPAPAGHPRRGQRRAARRVRRLPTHPLSPWPSRWSSSVGARAATPPRPTRPASAPKSP